MALNPIAFTERVVEDFLHYQLTTYPLADTDLYAQLRALLHLDRSRDTPLRKGPFISLSRPFKQGSSIAKLVSDGVFHQGMQAVVPAEHTHVRAHQDEAIRAIHRGDTTIVSTGTGSGKTEAFLYCRRAGETRRITPPVRTLGAAGRCSSTVTDVLAPV